MHYYAVNFVFNVSFRRGSKRKKNIQKKKGHFERSSFFLFQTFSRNDLPGEAPLSRGRSVFKKKLTFFAKFVIMSLEFTKSCRIDGNDTIFASKIL